MNSAQKALREPKTPKVSQPKRKTPEEKNRQPPSQTAAYRALLQQRKYGIIFLGLDMTILEINERAADMLGYSRKEIIGRDGAPLIAPEQPEPTQAAGALESGGRLPPSYQRVWRRQDGRQVIAAIDANLVRDADGRPAFYQIFARDITERSQMEEALQLSRKLISALSHLATLPLELDMVLQAAADGLAETLGISQCAIALVDADKQNLVIAADHPGPEVESLAGRHFTRRYYQDILALISRQEILYIDNPDEFPFSPETRSLISQRKARSLLIAPIVAQQNVIGFVTCAAVESPRHFSQLEIELVQTVTNLVSNRIEQTYLYEAERRQWAHSRTLQELGVILTSSLNLDEVLNTIGNQILSLMDVSSCTIMLLEPPDELVWRTTIGLPEEIRRIGRQKVGEGLSGWVAAHRQTLQVEHAYNDPRLMNAELRRRHGYYTFLGVPMEVKGELVGVFEIFTMEPRRFDEEEEALLAAFARQAAVAVENARLFAALNRRVLELEQLYQAAQALSVSLEKEKVLLKLAEQLTQIMDVTSAYILEANEALTHQTVVAEYWTEEANDQERISDMGVVYDLTNFQTIAQAIKSGRALNFHDDSQFVSPAAREELQQYGVKSALVVPIVRSGRVYGEVELWESRRKREFTPREIKLAQTIAQHAASVIENARLFARVQEHAALLEAEVTVRTAELEISNEQLRQEIEERKRVEKELLSRSISLSTINSLANTIYRTFNVRELVNEALDKLINYPNFMGVAIFRWNEREQTLHLVAQRGFSEDVVKPGRVIPVEGSLNGLAVRRKETVITYDLLHDDRLNPHLARLFYDKGARGMIVVPIIARDEVFGVYSTILPENVTLTQQEQEMLIAISSSLGLAMANARYVTQIQNEIEERRQIEAKLQAKTISLATINSIAEAAYRTFDLAEIVRHVVQTLHAYPKFIGVSVFSLNEQEKRLDLLDQIGFDAIVQAGNRHLSLESSINGTAVREKKIVISYDLPHDDRADPTTRQLLQQAGYHGVVVVPIIYKDKVLGTYSVILPKDARVTDQELAMLKSISTTVGLAMSNARYVRQIEAEIRERQQVEEELKIYAIELERSNQELQDFAYVASHDLQEPLRKIQAFGDRLQQRYSDALDERGLDYLRRMQSAATRMRTQIEDLLAFSRVTTAAQPFRWVDMGEIVAGVLADLEIRIEETAAVVETGPLPTIMADPAQMRQLMLNLLSNALKFHRPDTPPRVQVSGRYTQDDSQTAGDRPASRQMAQIVVQDNGIGFDEKYRERIFNLYERLHSRQEYAGTGMGLAICRKIVLRHNGRIQAKSRPGEGAVFIVTLPVEQ